MGASNTIGGLTTADRNVISGNNQGIQINGASGAGNLIIGNYIGVDGTGLLDVGNTDDGIEFDGAPMETRLAAPLSLRNVISGNDDDGISTETNANVIQGNYIGVGADGTTALGNSSDGVEFWGNASSNLAGGTTSGQGNLISNNGSDGIFVSLVGGTPVGNRTVIQSLKLGQEMPVTANLPRQAGIQIKERKNHTATILSSFVLNDVGAEHETWHLELTADGADYQPGDSIGIVPENAVEIVDAIIQEINLGESELIRFKEKEVTIRELLQKKVNIHYLPERIIKKYASIVQQEIPETRIDLLDLLRIYPVNHKAQAREILAALPAQSPRIYTIASSPNTHTDEIHLTVEKEIFATGQEIKTGTCSAYISGLSVGANLDFFVQRNKRFKLPAADKDIILIGPGTGIAAFRSFLSERDSLGATGKNWLFFGEKHFVSDFFYQTEIQDWFATGVLTKINLAFSEDQPKGKYVWHKMLEQGKELFEWIQAGAYIYVCGRKVPMSAEVEKALIQIIEIHGDLSATAARDYFEKIKEAGRFAKDVY